MLINDLGTLLANLSTPFTYQMELWVNGKLHSTYPSYKVMKPSMLSQQLQGHKVKFVGRIIRGKTQW